MNNNFNGIDDFTDKAKDFVKDTVDFAQTISDTWNSNANCQREKQQKSFHLLTAMRLPNNLVQRKRMKITKKNNKRRQLAPSLALKWTGENCSGNDRHPKADPDFQKH